MRFMMIVKASGESEAGGMPEKEMIEAMTKFNEEMANAGVLLEADGLHPSSEGVRIKFSGDKRTVEYGPFPNPTDLIAGYWIIKVKSKEEAIQWAKRSPNPMKDIGVIELRQIFEAEEFGEEFTPELRQREQKIREKVGAKK